MNEPRCIECGGPNRRERVRDGKRFCAECGMARAMAFIRAQREAARARYLAGLPVERPWRYRDAGTTS